MNRTPETYTDEWGVTYTAFGRILQKVDPDLFTCEEYTIPEGVEAMADAFWLTDGTLRKIHLPGTLRKMDDNAFIHCSLEELELPVGLTEVPGCMCEGCVELKRVVLPSTIRKIAISAFNCCLKLQEINLPDCIEYVEGATFRSCESLRHVRLPSNLRMVSPEMFYGGGIECIELPETVTLIGYWAFWGCNHLRSLIIPRSVKSIEYGIVSAHEGFEGIDCRAEGYHVEDDALIDDEKHEMLCCWTQQKHYVVPECVRRIADFGGNEFVEIITAKQPIELTTYDVFSSDINLRRVDFRGGVEGLSENTFWNCPKLETK